MFLMKNPYNVVKVQHPFYGFLGGIFALFMLLALLDYDPVSSCFHASFSKGLWHAHGNRLGFLGVFFAFYASRWLGIVVWGLPIYALWASLCWILCKRQNCTLRKTVCFVFFVLFASILGSFLEYTHCFQSTYKMYSAGIGGLLGSCGFKHVFAQYFGDIGTALILFPLCFISLILAFTDLGNFYYWIKEKTHVLVRLMGALCGFISKQFKAISPRLLEQFKRLKSIHWLPKKTPSKDIIYEDKTSAKSVFKSSTENFETVEEIVRKREPVAKKSVAAIVEEKVDQERAEAKTADESDIKVLASEVVEKATKAMPNKAGEYLFPPVDVLKNPPPVLHTAETEDYYETAKELVMKLAEFGVEVKVEAIQSGPVITRYEVTPARGVRVEKIATLDKNIALGLKALSVRIQAPVPGKGCVGIEVPNKKALPVCLREILESKAWETSDAEIPIVLGKEVTGKPIVTDLARMPHLLIAGSTGSGKTVCINTIIASLLFHASPKDLRFIMVDPKIVEMKIYNNLPHMLIPVVTDPKRVPSALKWLIGEMERRYQLFANYGARNITSFNDKVKKMSPNELAEKSIEHLPYIVCIIDELADLMMVAPGDIETCIARLAQLARAAGIHLIIATQRPSVNVITGIIKANLPSRIAFKVASKVDSRTILDMGGADNLIGKGDMLFIPPGASQLIRAQGAWVSDDEIVDMVEFLKRNGPPAFAEDVQRMIEIDDNDEGVDFGDSGDDEPLLSKALDVLKSSDKVSTSLLQRRLKIGYNRAARIMETLEERGLVPHDTEL